MAASNGLATPFLAGGTRQDLQHLYNKFEEIGTLAFKDFAKLFREMKYDTIFYHRICPAEYVEFAEYILQRAAYYFQIFNEYKEFRRCSERIYGIYICYALYHIQPADHVCQINVTVTQLNELLTFEKQLIKENHLDALACLHTLISKKAFNIVAMHYSYDPSTHKKYLTEEDNSDFSRVPVEPFKRMKTVLDNKLFGEMSLLHEAYVKSKMELGVADRIHLVDARNPTSESQQILEKYEQKWEARNRRARQVDFEAENGDEDEIVPTFKESAGESRSNLRDKAYNAGLKHTRQRRYLDPNMEENFKNIPDRYQQIASDISQEPADGPVEDDSTESPTKQKKEKRKRRPRLQFVEIVDDHALAEKTLKEAMSGLMSGIKTENVTENEETVDLTGTKQSKQGTSTVAKIRAPKRKAPNVVQLTPKKNNTGVASTSTNILDLTKTPEAKPPKMMRIHASLPGEWTNKLKKLTKSEMAADKTMEKLRNQFKLDIPDVSDDGNSTTDT